MRRASAASIVLAALAVLAPASPARAQPWTDNTITPGNSVVRAADITELRNAVNNRLVNFNYGPATWTDDPIVAGNTMIRTVHINEMRNYVSNIGNAYQSFCPSVVPAAPSWTDSPLNAGSTLVRGVHVTELRSAVNNVGSCASCCTGNVCISGNVYNSSSCGGGSGCAISNLQTVCNATCQGANYGSGCSNRVCTYSACPTPSPNNCFSGTHICTTTPQCTSGNCGCTSGQVCSNKCVNGSTSYAASCSNASSGCTGNAACPSGTNNQCSSASSVCSYSGVCTTNGGCGGCVAGGANCANLCLGANNYFAGGCSNANLGCQTPTACPSGNSNFCLGTLVTATNLGNYSGGCTGGSGCVNTNTGGNNCASMCFNGTTRYANCGNANGGCQGSRNCWSLCGNTPAGGFYFGSKCSGAVCNSCFYSQRNSSIYVGASVNVAGLNLCSNAGGFSNAATYNCTGGANLIVTVANTIALNNMNNLGCPTNIQCNTLNAAWSCNLTNNACQ